MKQSKIAVIGAGAVGSTTAYALMLRNIISDICIVDALDLKCQGEVEDLSDVLSFSTTSSITMGTLQEAGQADIIIITAGIAQKKGQSRTDLLKVNSTVIQSICDGMRPLNREAIIIVVTNPVDVLTHLVQKLTQLPYGQVFGSGTLLDSQRIRNAISKKIGVSPQSIHLYVLGEHGDSQVVAWSCGTVANVPLLQYPGLSFDELQKMAQESKNKAYSIIACKGSTSFGVASCVAAYCQNILFDAKRVTPVSCFNKEYEIYMSMPAIMGKNGIEQVVTLPLNEEEKKLLDASAEVIKQGFEHCF